MKKLYLTITFALAVLLQASAITFAERTTTLTPGQPVQRPAAEKAATPHRAAAAVEHQWESMGLGQMTDDILTGLFSSITPYNVELEMEKDELNPGYYRIVDPYSLRNPYYDQLAGLRPEGDNASGRYIVINATDPDNVIIEPSNIGLFYQGEELFVTSYSYYESTGEVTAAYMDTYGLRGTYKNGIISFPGLKSLWISTPSADARGSGFYGDRNGYFRVQLPGSKDYSIEVLTAGWCAYDNGAVIFSPWCGADVATVKAGILRHGYTADDIKAILNSNETFVANQGAYIMVDGDVKPNEPLYIVAIALDAAGMMQEYAVHMVYAPDTTDNWSTLPAKAKYTDGLVSNVYSDLTIGTYEVEVQENNDRPGYYRVVNPYQEVSYNMMEADTHGTHNHYMYFDATDPDCVILEASPLGIVVAEDGDMRVSSSAYDDIQNGLTKEAIALKRGAGTLKNGKITFPHTALIYMGWHTEGIDAWWLANYNEDYYGNRLDGPLCLDLSAALGVDDVIASESNGTVEYFNLQGMRVTYPAAGQLVIRRTGDKAEKVIVR